MDKVAFMDCCSSSHWFVVKSTGTLQKLHLLITEQYFGQTIRHKAGKQLFGGFSILTSWQFFLLLSCHLSQRKSGENDLLPTAGQEGAIPQLWGWGLASTQWRRSVIRGQEEPTDGRWWRGFTNFESHATLRHSSTWINRFISVIVVVIKQYIAQNKLNIVLKGRTLIITSLQGFSRLLWIYWQRRKL